MSELNWDMFDPISFDDDNSHDVDYDDDVAVAEFVGDGIPQWNWRAYYDGDEWSD